MQIDWENCKELLVDRVFLDLNQYLERIQLDETSISIDNKVGRVWSERCAGIIAKDLKKMISWNNEGWKALVQGFIDSEKLEKQKQELEKKAKEEAHDTRDKNDPRRIADEYWATHDKLSDEVSEIDD